MKSSIIEVKDIQSVCIYNNWDKTPKKFCVIIPTHKRAALLKFSIESVLNQQQYDDYEILIVDNNPERDDKTELLLKDYCNIPNLAYYKNQENVGMVGNWNKLSLIARSEWLVMLHDDDMLYPDFFVNMDRIVNKLPDAAAIYCNYTFYNKEDGSLPERGSDRKIKYYQLNYGDFVLWNVAGAPVGMTYKRSACIAVNGFDERYYPVFDYHFHTKLTDKFITYKLEGYQLSCYRWFANETLKPGIGYSFSEKNSLIVNEILSQSYIFRYIKNSCTKVVIYNSIVNTWNLDPNGYEEPKEIEQLLWRIIVSFYKLSRKIRQIFATHI